MKHWNCKRKDGVQESRSVSLSVFFFLSVYVHVDAPESSHLSSIHVHTCRHPRALWGRAILERAHEPCWAGQSQAGPAKRRRGLQRGGCLALRRQCCARLAGWRLMPCQDSLPRWQSSNTGWSVSVPTPHPPPAQTTVFSVCVFIHAQAPLSYSNLHRSAAPAKLN